MLTKLDAIYKRYQTLFEKLGDPDVLSDTSTWQKLSKEQAEIAETAEKYQEYLQTQEEMDAAFATAESETDAEMMPSVSLPANSNILTIIPVNPAKDAYLLRVWGVAGSAFLPTNRRIRKLFIG